MTYATMPRTGLFIGRFQPFHNGHLATVKFALGKVDRLVIVVGSAQKSHEPRNPFTAGERIMMIKGAIDADAEIESRRILIIPVPDVDVHSTWTAQVSMLVPEYDVVISNDPFTLFLFGERRVKVIGAPLHKRSELAATEIRNMMAMGDKKWINRVPPNVTKIVRKIGGEKRVKAIAENQQAHRHGH